MLRLREHSQAAYRTSAGRSVASVGYADDVEHYGSGLVDLPVILAELSAGSVATGIGFSWRKFWAYASDWDQALPHLPPDASAVVFVNGANVQSWDIWAGGVRQPFLPRGDHARIDRLVGKRGVLFDRHSLPAEDLLSKFAAARRRLSAKHCSWDECLALYQWVMRGAASYVPLVGIPAPVSLHEEDACFQRLLLSALGVRSTAERVSLLAASHIGGLGAPSVVETLVASCASDLITLLSGSSTASLVARDSLRHALLLPPQQAEDWDGLVVRGMRFLSGYGFHITVSTDRFVGRVLDLLAAHSAHPHALLGPFDPAVFPLRSGFVEWGWWPTRCAPFLRNSVALLSPLVPGGMLRNGPRAFQLIAGLLLARATGSALANAAQEWRAECALFRPDVPPPPFSQIGLTVHGKTLGAILRIRAVNIWIRLLIMRPRTGTSQSLGMVVLFLLGLLVFVRKRAGLVLRPVIGTVTPTSRPGLLLACRNSLAPGRCLCMWPSWFHCWSVFAGAVLTRGTY